MDLRHASDPDASSAFPVPLAARGRLLLYTGRKQQHSVVAQRLREGVLAQGAGPVDEIALAHERG